MYLKKKEKNSGEVPTHPLANPRINFPKQASSCQDGMKNVRITSDVGELQKFTITWTKATLGLLIPNHNEKLASSPEVAMIYVEMAIELRNPIRSHW